MMKAWYENDQDSKAIAELLSQNAMGSDYNYFSTGSQFPTIMATPVSADVVAEDEIRPSFDWRARILKENFMPLRRVPRAAQRQSQRGPQRRP